MCGDRWGPEAESAHEQIAAGGAPAVNYLASFVSPGQNKVTIVVSWELSKRVIVHCKFVNVYPFSEW